MDSGNNIELEEIVHNFNGKPYTLLIRRGDGRMSVKLNIDNGSINCEIPKGDVEKLSIQEIANNVIELSNLMFNS